MSDEPDDTEPASPDEDRAGDRSRAADGAGAAAGPVAGSEDPAGLLSEVRAVRRQARRARHAYWFPLVLFGLLTCASVPFYIQRYPAGYRSRGGHAAGRAFARHQYLGGPGPLIGVGNSYYWLAAILAGLAATAVWYRLRGDRVGLRSPSRGYVVTGLALLVLALLIPALTQFAGLPGLAILMPGDLTVRGTFPFVIIAIGLCFLAWAERSIALAVIAASYLALSLAASLYDISNVFYRLGWFLGPSVERLPNVVLPALVLLLSGAGAWVVQRQYRGRQYRGRPAEPPAAGSAA